MTLFAGVDIGSNTAKAALIKDHIVIATHIIPSGYNHSDTAQKVFQAVLEKSGSHESQVRTILSTGYGRNSVDFADKKMTEIICHAAGAFFLHPGIQSIIDVGGQDSKTIALNKDGNVDNFAMNDKCAAGTGRFIEVMAKTLDLPLERMGELSLHADRPLKISSICTVFAESEVISMIARQEKRENIIAGIHASAAARITGLAEKISLQPPVMMTGGVAKNHGMVAAIERCLNIKLIVENLAQETGAIGAAVLASRL